jgi:phage baseplate assembly protein V
MDDNSIRDMFMSGVVTEVIGNRARVLFEDRDNMVSAPLQVIQAFTGDNKSIFMPSVGEKVACLFLPTGQEDGFIIGSIYEDDNQPPAENNAVLFEDGSRIDFKDGILNINMLQAVNITTPTMTLNGNQVINGNLSTTGTSKTQGSLSVTGEIKSNSDVKAGNVSLKNHTNGGYGVDQ